MGLDKPEGDPGAHDNNGEGNVDLEEVEAECSLKGELDKDDGPVAPPHGVKAVPVGPVDHHVLGQAQLLHAMINVRRVRVQLKSPEGLGGPLVLEVRAGVTEASDL